ncbi:MAG TPA: PAS domain-containing protein [Caulobacteraceae bacterium]|nr:PAS domain-containing protein [Caulobacteraceae bacterium]
MIGEAERLSEAVDAAGLGLWRYDLRTGALDWDARLKALYGLSPDAPTSFESFVAGVHPDDRASVLGEFESALNRPGGRDFSVEHRTVAPDGTVRWVVGAGRILRDETGAAYGVVGTSWDITARKTAELALADSERRLRALGDNLPFAMLYQVAVSPDGARRRFLHLSHACERLNGVSVEAALADADVLYGLIEPEDLPRLVEAEAEAIRARSAFDVEVRFRLKDGTVRWSRLVSAPRRSEDGGTVWDGVQIDITERRREQARRKLLTDELNHRVKNTLAIVQSIAAQSFAGDAATPEARARFEGRLMALASAHALLTRENWEGAAFRALTDEALAPLAPPGRLSLSGPDFRLDPRTAVTLAMALHELGTNAAKYGAWSSGSGDVRLVWTLVPEGETARLELVWRERGGPPVTAPERRGFGTRMVERGLAAEFGAGATLLFEPDGVVCALSANLPASAWNGQAAA